MSYLDFRMNPFSVRPDRAAPRRGINRYAYGVKTAAPKRFGPVLNPAQTAEFGKPDRKDRA